MLVALTGADDVADAFIEDRAAGARVSLSAFRSLGLARGVVSSSSRTAYTIRAAVRTRTGAVFVRRAVVQLGGDGETPYRILHWAREAGDAPLEGLRAAAR